MTNPAEHPERRGRVADATSKDRDEQPRDEREEKSVVIDAWMRMSEAVGAFAEDELRRWGFDPPRVAPTPRTMVLRDAGSRLYRFDAAGNPPRGPAVLLVPSLINRWYAFDLCAGYSVVEALQARGLDVFALDWGVFADAERDVGWDALLERLGRAVETVRSLSARGTPPHLVGYSIAGTLAATYAARRPGELGSLALLCAPMDFSLAGRLARAVDSRWFHPRLATAAGNVPPWQVLAGFATIQPVAFAEEALAAQRLWLRPAAGGEARARRTLRLAQTRWLYDGVPFPAAAFRTVVGEFYQRNALWKGEFRALGVAVDLGAITAPTLLITAADDAVCPPAATLALAERLPTARCETLSLRGAHLTSVAGEHAPADLYPALARWLLSHPVG